MTASNKKRILGFVLSAMILALSIGAFISVWDKWPNYDQWLIVFDQKHVTSVLLFFVCIALATLLRAFRWKRLMVPFHVLTRKEAFRIFGLSFFLVVFLPYRLGESARPLLIKKLGGSGLGTLGVQALERINDLIVVLICAALILSLLPQLEGWMQATGKVFLFSGLIAYALLVVLIKPIHKWLKKLSEGKDSGLLLSISHLSRGLSIIGERKEFFIQAVLTILIWSLLAAGYYIFLKSFFPEITWVAGPAIMVVITLSGLLPITPGNLGIYEAAAVFLLVQLGQSNENALVAAVTLHSAELLMALLIGLAAKTSFYIDSRKKL